jgi:hypothetical protein
MYITYHSLLEMLNKHKISYEKKIISRILILKYRQMFKYLWSAVKTENKFVKNRET